MKTPKISIITVSLNSSKTIRRTIESVLGQNYSNLEYILVDGGSTDGTVDIIRDYDDRISCWISEPDRGISDAFNKGIAMANGEIIGIINSDDGLLPNALQSVADAYDPDVDIYLGKLVIWDTNSNTKAIDVPSVHYNLRDTNHICHPSTFISKRAYEKYGVFDTALKYVMDYDLLLRFQNQGARSKQISVPLAFFTLAGRTPTNNYSPERLKETEMCLRKNGASAADIFYYYFIKGIKWLAKKLLSPFIKKEAVMRIKYKQYDGI